MNNENNNSIGNTIVTNMVANSIAGIRQPRLAQTLGKLCEVYHEFYQERKRLRGGGGELFCEKDCNEFFMHYDAMASIITNTLAKSMYAEIGVLEDRLLDDMPM